MNFLLFELLTGFLYEIWFFMRGSKPPVEGYASLMQFIICSTYGIEEGVIWILIQIIKNKGRYGGLYSWVDWNLNISGQTSKRKVKEFYIFKFGSR
jgi:hypothetical protein